MKAQFFIILLLAHLSILEYRDFILIADFKNIHLVADYYNQDYDAAPGLFIFMVLMLIFILICVGIGIVIAVLILGLLFGVIAIGLISSSVLVGLYRRSFLKGFKIFMISSSAIGCLILGIACFIVYNKFVHYWSLQTATLIGAISGSIAGMLLGFILFYMIRELTEFFYLKLKAK